MTYPDFDTLMLRTFVSLAETRSFTQTAEKIGRSQPAISQQVKKLEAMLGKELFNRSRQQISLTEEGEEFIIYARKILSIQQELFSKFLEPAMHGEIRFGTPEDFASIYLSEVLSSFARSHPRIRLNIECDLTLNLLEGFRRNSYDIVLLKQPTPHEDKGALTVWTEDLEWVGSPQFSLPLTTTEEPVQLVLSPMPCVYRERAIEALNKANIPWRLVYTSPSFAGAVAAVKAGLGITVLPRMMIPSSLIPLRLNTLPNLATTQIILMTQENALPVTHAFANYIISHLRATTLGRNH